MSGEAWLRGGLAELAEMYDVVDLSDRVATTSRRLQRRRVVAGSALAALLVLGGLAVATRYTGRAPQPPTGTPSPSVSAPEQLLGPMITIPSGALDLTNATLDLPLLPVSFPACQGRQTFTHNYAHLPTDEIGFSSYIERELTGDVNHDGRTDTVAVIRCEYSESVHWQVVAFEGTQENVHTIGQVFAPAWQPRLAVVFDLQVLTSGAVQAEVGDFLGVVVGHAAEVSTHQTRTYSWNGAAFRQVAGPTTFPPNPHFIDLHVTTSGLVLGQPVNGVRTGTLTVTVRNRASVPASSVEFDLAAPLWLQRVGPQWRQCQVLEPDTMARATCTIGEIAPGASRTLSLTFSAPVSSDALDAGQPSVTAYGSAMIFGTPYGEDARPGDETTGFSVTRA